MSPSLHVPMRATFPVDTCLMQVRKAWGIDGYPDNFKGARTAYNAWLYAGGDAGANTHTDHYHIHGMPIFLKGRGAAGHVCIYDADGYVLTTDYPRSNHWNRVKLSVLAKAWGMKVLGGSETLLGVRVLPHHTY